MTLLLFVDGARARPSDPIRYRCARCGRDDVADPDAHADLHGCELIEVRPEVAR